MWPAVEQALAEFAADAAIPVLVFTGAGDKAFLSGADFSTFESAGWAALAECNATAERVYSALYALPRPTIARIPRAQPGRLRIT